MLICLDTNSAAKAAARRVSALVALPALVVETDCGRAIASGKSQRYCCPWQLQTADAEASGLSKLVEKEAGGHHSRVAGTLRLNSPAQI